MARRRLQPAAVTSRDLSGDGEPPPAPAPATARAAREYGDRRGQARPGVGDLDAHPPADTPAPQLDCSSPVLDRVGEQVAAGLRQADAVTGNHRGRGVGRQEKVQLDAAGFGDRTPCLGRLGQHVVKRNRLERVGRPRTPPGRGKVFERQPGATQLSVHGREPPPGYLVATIEQMQPNPHRSERAADLVAGARDQLHALREASLPRQRQAQGAEGDAPPSDGGEYEAHVTGAASTSR